MVTTIFGAVIALTEKTRSTMIIINHPHTITMVCSHDRPHLQWSGISIVFSDAAPREDDYYPNPYRQQDDSEYIDRCFSDWFDGMVSILGQSYYLSYNQFRDVNNYCKSSRNSSFALHSIRRPFRSQQQPWWWCLCKSSPTELFSIAARILRCELWF